MVNMNFNPYEIMSEFYRLDNPTEEDQFVFVEALSMIIKDSDEPEEIEVASFNLAMYYRDIKNFELEKKYLEICLEQDSDVCKEPLGELWYYGYGGFQDYEKAFKLFSECESKKSMLIIADMYHYGHYVEQDIDKCRQIVEKIFVDTECERNDDRFKISTLFPEVALRLVTLDIEDGTEDDFDFDCLLDARIILSYRQKHRPFWGNLKLMKEIIDLILEMLVVEYEIIDFYDLLSWDYYRAKVTFTYKNKEYAIDIFPDNDEIVYQFGNKWYHSAEDLLEKACIDQRRLTTICDEIDNLQVDEHPENINVARP